MANHYSSHTPRLPAKVAGAHHRDTYVNTTIAPSSRFLIVALFFAGLLTLSACDTDDPGGVSNTKFPVVVQNDYTDSLFTVSFTVTDAKSPHTTSGTLFSAERIEGLKSKKSEDVIHADSDDTVVIRFSATSLGQVRTFEPITVEMDEKRYGDTAYRITYDYDLATASFRISHGWGSEYGSFAADGGTLHAHVGAAMNCPREDGFCDLYPEPPIEDDDGGSTVSDPCPGWSSYNAHPPCLTEYFSSYTARYYCESDATSACVAVRKYYVNTSGQCFGMERIEGESISSCGG